MATRRLDPHQRKEIEDRLTELGFTWEYRPDEPLDAINVEKSRRNQARLGNPVKPATLERYKAAMSNGAKFPAVVAATQQLGGHLLVDGNHRDQAYRETRHKSIPMYLIIDGDPQGITILTFELNTTHGDATTDEERIHQGLWMVDNGMAIEEAARRLGLKATSLRAANTQHQADARADMVGLDRREWEHLNQGVRTRLYSISTDEGFAELGKLTIQAKLTLAEVGEHVKSLGDLRSSSKQVEYVKALRDMYADRLQRGGGPAKSGRAATTPRALMMMAIGQVNNLPTAGITTLRLAEHEREEILKKVRSAREKLESYEKALESA